MAPFDERRQAARIGVSGNMSVESVPPGPPLWLVDVGTGGFRVQAVAPMLPDEVTSYRFATSDEKWSAIFRARVVYCKLTPSGEAGVAHYRIGLMFENGESQAVQRQLMALIDHATAFVSSS